MAVYLFSLSKNIESLSDVNAGSWRFLKSYSSRHGTTQQSLDVVGHGEGVSSSPLHGMSMLSSLIENSALGGATLASATNNNNELGMNEGAMLEPNQFQGMHAVKSSSSYRSGLPSLRTALESGLARHHGGSDNEQP